MNTGKKARLIALDIDGTLIDMYLGVPVHKKVRDAVREAREAGVKVCLCSARPGYFMQDATDGLDGVDALIGCSGATIEVEGEMIYKAAIPLPQLLACFETAMKHDIYMSFVGDEKILVRKKGLGPPPFDQGSVFAIHEDGELKEALKNGDFYCAFIFAKAGVKKEDVFGDPIFEEVTIHMASHDSFNITNGGTDKGRAVLKLAELWGIDREEILAVGNDENDIPMFEIAGMSAAVANAGKKALEAADLVVPNVKRGGAAVAIRHFAL